MAVGKVPVVATAGEQDAEPGGYLTEGARGYLLFDADAAVEPAARIAAARHGGAIEVRPVAAYW